MPLIFGAVPIAGGQAATATGTMAVTATVLSFCTITPSALAFGSYSTVVLNVSTTIAVLCTNTTPYNIGLDQGVSSGATVTTRKMTNGAATLSYSLYSDSGRTTNWGNSAGSWVAGVATGATQTLTVYGSIPAAQSVTPGAYTDTITATVNY